MAGAMLKNTYFYEEAQVHEERYHRYAYIYMGVVLKVLVRSLVFGDHRCWLR